MTFLLDTNAVSELTKRRIDPGFAAWYRVTPVERMYTSVLVLGEVCRGVERKRRTDPVGAVALERWKIDLERMFGERIIPVGRAVGELWGRLTSHRTVSVVDSLLAATAKLHGHRFVTRNTRDVADLGVALLDPFAR